MSAQANAFIGKHWRQLFLIVSALALQGLIFRGHMDCILNRIPSFDCDGYWHLLRVQDIHQTGSWDNEINPRGNAPFGERIHWTRAMDLVLWTGASVGACFMDFDSSLHWWGVFVGPAFYMLSLIAILVLAGLWLDMKSVTILGALFLINPIPLLCLYSVNRPDHHCLLAFLYVLYYLLFLAVLERPESGKLALCAGIAGAVGLWAGIEFVVLVGLSVLFLGSLWIIRGQRYLRSNCLLALALTAGLMATVLLDEKPEDYWIAAYDKRSIVHVVLFLSALLFWLTAILLRNIGVGKAVSSRLPVAIGGGALIAAVCLILFPGLLQGPMGEVDPRLRGLYLDQTGEFASMAASGSVLEIACYGLMVFPGLAYLLWAVHRNFSGKRVVYSWLALTIGVYGLMAVMMGRWLHTLAFLSIFPTAFFLRSLSYSRTAGHHPILACAGIVTLLCAPYAALLIPGHSSAELEGGVHPDYYKKLVAMLSFMESEGSAAAGETVLANMDVGPAVMYHSPFNAVGTCNHSNVDGILDTYRILNSQDDASAYAIVERRGIDYLLCDKPLIRFARRRIPGFSNVEDRPAGPVLIDRLQDGQIPAWLTRMAVPEGLADTFTLYRVVDGERRFEAVEDPNRQPTGVPSDIGSR